MHISRGECDLGTPSSNLAVHPPLTYRQRLPAATLTLTISPLYDAVATISRDTDGGPCAKGSIEPWLF